MDDTWPRSPADSARPGVARRPATRRPSQSTPALGGFHGRHSDRRPRPWNSLRLPRLEQCGRRARGLDDSEYRPGQPADSRRQTSPHHDLQARPDESVTTQVAVAGPGGLGPARRRPATVGQSTSDLLPPAGRAPSPRGADCQSAGWIRTRTARCKRRAGGAADPTPLRPRPVTAPRLGWTHQQLGLDSDVTSPPAKLHGNPSTSRRPRSGPPGLPESPCHVGQDGAQRPVPTTRLRRPALRAARAAGSKFAGPTAAASTQPALRTQVSPSGHPSVRSLTPPPGPPSPDPLSRFSPSHACPAAHRESHTFLHFSGPRIAAAIYTARDPQNSSQHHFPSALARTRTLRIEATFRNPATRFTFGTLSPTHGSLREGSLQARPSRPPSARLGPASPSPAGPGFATRPRAPSGPLAPDRLSGTPSAVWAGKPNRLGCGIASTASTPPYSSTRSQAARASSDWAPRGATARKTCQS